MHTIPGYLLWLGHAGDVRDLRGLHAAGIVAVVDLAFEEPSASISRELVYARFPLVDGPGNPEWILRATATLVEALIIEGIPTLIGCGAGLSRSPCIAAAGIARARGIPADEGLALALRSAPADVSPGLWADVRRIVG